MLTIKWTQTSGAINIFETKRATVVRQRTDAWEEQKQAEPDMIHDNLRALIHYDGGTIAVFAHDQHCYIVNENGKTVETV